MVAFVRDRLLMLNINRDLIQSRLNFGASAQHTSIQQTWPILPIKTDRSYPLFLSQSFSKAMAFEFFNPLWRLHREAFKDVGISTSYPSGRRLLSLP